MSVEQHVARGTYRADRHGPISANVVSVPSSAPADLPRPPKGLTRASRKLWAALITEYEGWRPENLAMLGAALGAIDRAEQCRLAIQREGLMIRGPRGGGVRPHPLIKVQRDAEQFVSNTFVRLGVAR